MWLYFLCFTAFLWQTIDVYVDIVNDDGVDLLMVVDIKL